MPTQIDFHQVQERIQLQVQLQTLLKRDFIQRVQTSLMNRFHRFRKPEDFLKWTQLIQLKQVEWIQLKEFKVNILFIELNDLLQEQILESKTQTYEELYVKNKGNLLLFGTSYHAILLVLKLDIKPYILVINTGLGVENHPQHHSHYQLIAKFYIQVSFGLIKRWNFLKKWF